VLSEIPGAPPVAVSLNKSDLLTSEERARRLREVLGRGMTAQLTSAKTGLGVQDLARAAISIGRAATRTGQTH
jgi:50S ribosomal subunit-associated GTPase HflX